MLSAKCCFNSGQSFNDWRPDPLLESSTPPNRNDRPEAPRTRKITPRARPRGANLNLRA